MNSRICIIFIFLSTFGACREGVINIDKSDSDTLNILRVALYEGTSDKFMPSASALRKANMFSDSILLTSDELPLKILTSAIQSEKFKLLSRQQICSMLTADTNRIELPNYLMISRFEKSDTGYYVQVENLSCVPFGGGGSLGLYFKKVGDSLTIIGRATSSIN